MTQAMSNSPAAATADRQIPAPMLAGKFGIELRTLDEFYRFAKYILASGLAPKGIQTPEAVVVLLQYGAELGLKPMMAIQGIKVVNGRPSCFGDLLLAVCRGSMVWSEQSFIEESDGKTWSCTVGRKGQKPVTRTFSVDDAKRAKLWGKAGPWTDYPQRMLQMRARSFALRDTFADVLCGMVAWEEAIDLEHTGDELRRDAVLASIATEPTPEAKPEPKPKPARGVRAAEAALGIPAPAPEPEPFEPPPSEPPQDEPPIDYSNTDTGGGPSDDDIPFDRAAVLDEVLLHAQRVKLTNARTRIAQQYKVLQWNTTALADVSNGDLVEILEALKEIA